MDISWMELAFGAMVVIAQGLSFWFMYWLFKKLRKPKSVAPAYAPGTGLDGKAIAVLATFIGLRRLPWVALASNSLNPVFRLEGQQVIYRVLRQKQRPLGDVSRVDMRSAYGTFNLVFEFADSPFTLIVNLGSASRMAYVLSLLPPGIPLSERAQAARLAGNAAQYQPWV
ncbi:MULTISPECIES: hypothetical protein [Pseudomonas]|uniref:Uncharacterized protein n=1 Tax=Pseudomonas gessardii TaxID=78544 RepID=A0A7Y1MK16_9PSED|nr:MULTISPECIES: hypothetical protein [Pseudomonas]MBH3423439.1 hypothetical protein [Pseudomonas gessardii]MRU49325.1 hypothetical protein [Pseudomonas gessardii]NNA93568.1 hypothetical protein [Pseudomonas gessardii]PHN54841.1 hypothetical protein AO268_25000 [Pseudomonas sp. ICMP 8385]SDR37519.1 hypothetical protein SAMN04490207_5728 [Pseudomonas gessardii]